MRSSRPSAWAGWVRYIERAFGARAATGQRPSELVAKPELLLDPLPAGDRAPLALAPFTTVGSNAYMGLSSRLTVASGLNFDRQPEVGVIGGIS